MEGMGNQKAAVSISALEVLHQTFPDLDETAVQHLHKLVSSGHYQAGEDICRAGDVGTTLHILASGEASIIVQAEEGQEVVVDTIGPNNYFGEVAFFGGSIRTATIRSLTPCQTLEIEHADFMSLANKTPQLLTILLKQIIGHLRRNDKAVINTLNEKNAALQKAYAHLARQEELRKQFITMLSHELRTPLTSIRGFLGLINKGAIAGDSLNAALNSITRNAERLVRLTDDLLILYEMYPGVMEYGFVSPNDVTVAALKAAQEKVADSQRVVELDIVPGLPRIYADQNALTFAISALIENAFKFDPDKHPITVRVYRSDEGQVAISIRDQGIGIPHEAQGRIFDPFIRLEQEGSAHLFPGLGVGLTIVQEVVEQHNGRIEVESYPGRGSIFTVYLPAQ